MPLWTLTKNVKRPLTLSPTSRKCQHFFSTTSKHFLKVLTSFAIIKIFSMFGFKGFISHTAIPHTMTFVVQRFVWESVNNLEDLTAFCELIWNSICVMTDLRLINQSGSQKIDLLSHWISSEPSAQSTAPSQRLWAYKNSPLSHSSTEKYYLKWNFKIERLQ